jgi:hypothetical protein
MPQGDYNFYQRMYASKNTQLMVVAATDDTTLITPKTTSHQIWVQKIVVDITTYSAKTWNFEDSTGTPVPIWHISIPGGAVALPSESNSMVADFGPEGIALPIGKNLVLNVSAAGAAGAVKVMAYERLAAPVAAGSTN